MNLSASLKTGWLTKAFTAMRHAARPSFWGQLLKRTRFDYRKEVGDCLDSSVVTAPVLWVARALPEAKLTVMREDRQGKTEEVRDHPMLALIQKPNPYYGDIALWMATVVMFLIFGEAYWLIVRNSYGRPAELWFVPNWTMDPRAPQDGSEFISHYRYSPGGGSEPINIDPEDVIHFRHGINPRDMRHGLSPLDGVIREIFVDLESSNFVASLLRNMGVPGVVISPEGGGARSEDVEAMKVWFKQAFGGDNRGQPLVVGAPTKVQSYGFNPQQMNMSEGRDVAEERVCACIGVPAAVVGFGAGLQQTKVGATMGELRKLAWNNGVLPYAGMLVDELDRSLLPQFGNPAGLKSAWDTDNVQALQEDEDKKSDRALKQFQGGLITHHQALRIVGEETPTSADFYLRPIAMIEVPVGSDSAAVLEARAAASAPKALPAPGAKAQRQAGEDAYKRGYAWALTLQRHATGQQEALESRLIPFFGRIGKQAAEAATPLLEADPTLGKALRQAQDEQKGEKADELLVAMILDKLGIDRWEGDLRSLYEAHYLEVAKAMNDAAERAGLGASLPDPVARSIIAAGGRRVGLVDLEGQTRAALFEALAEGRAEGEGATQLANRIAGLVENGPSDSPLTRSRRIARTETKYAQNISTIERARAAGVTSMIVYDGRLGPGRSLPSHMARNGSIVSIAEAEIMAGEEHPNGTLSFAPSFE